MKDLLNAVVIAALLFGAVMSGINTHNIKSLTNKGLKIVVYDTIAVYDTIHNIISDSLLYNEIKRIGIKFPEIVFKQALLETGYFKSKLFRHNNNLFGMKHPRNRITISRGNLNGYAYYSSWKESVIDYGLWQRYNFTDGTEVDYYNLLKNVYAEDNKYIYKLRNLDIRP